MAWGSEEENRLRMKLHRGKVSSSNKLSIGPQINWTS